MLSSCARKIASRAVTGFGRVAGGFD